LSRSVNHDFGYEVHVKSVATRGKPKANFDAVAEAIAAIRKGNMVVVVDDRNRENEGDVVFAASKSTAAKINFLAKHARGLICVAMTADRVEALELPMMVQDNLSPHETAFTISVEVRQGTTTGISASDRSLTAIALADEKSVPKDFVSPGHVFPIKARRGGVLVRAGHTEAAVDLVAMAGLGKAGVICEIMNEDGSMARLKDCIRFAKRHALPLISVEDLISHRRTREKLVKVVAQSEIVTPFGPFTAKVYEDVIHGRRHVALVGGPITANKPVLVRVHSENLLEDVFWANPGIGDRVHNALAAIAEKGGIFLYMRPADAGEDLPSWLSRLGNKGTFTAGSIKPGKTPMDSRTYGIGAQILFDLGVRNLELMTNNQRRIQGLEGYGLKIARQVAMPPAPKIGPRIPSKSKLKSKVKTEPKKNLEKSSKKKPLSAKARKVSHANT
jgi:3,4-dihydroxy 2-butanone 4-phosphate synthase / GTP cyclohydrolase II